MTTAETYDRELTNTIQDTWRLLMDVGVVLTIIGLLAIVTPFFTGITLSFLFGTFLIVGAIAHFIHAFSGHGWKLADRLPSGPFSIYYYASLNTRT